MSRKEQTRSRPVDIPSEDAGENAVAYIAEAEQVDQMTRTPGYQILKRDLDMFRDTIGKNIAYLNPSTKDFQDARITYLACDKIISMVEEYATHKKSAIELLKKIDSPKTDVAFDFDNE